MNSVNTPKLLSTKVLTESQKALIHSNAIEFKEYDAIKIQLLPFLVPKTIKNAIFSSKNAIKAVKKHNFSLFSGNIENCFCVGETTKALLVKNGQKALKSAKNASELANFIIKEHKNESFYFFCGSRRRDEIPSALKKAKIKLFEIEVYKTELKPLRFDEKFDGVLFFSPSGVESFVAANKIENSSAFCIGETTASEARKYTKNVQLAATTSVKSTVELAVNTLKNDNN